MKTYRGAIVGLSGIGTGSPPVRQKYPVLGTEWPHSHVAAYHAFPQTDVVAVCDIKPDVIEKFRATWGAILPDVHSYTDYREMLERERVELLMARLTIRELRRTLHPRAILPVKLGGRVVPEHILRDIQVFMLFYLLTFAIGTAIVVALGADLMTGITASIACLGNIGPGFGPVGPMGSFADLHPVSKIVLTLEMWIGRLEVMTVLVLFRLEAWRTARCHRSCADPASSR